MKPADIILVKGTDILDKLIEDAEHSVYSHCALAINDTTVIQAAFAGVDYLNINSFDIYDVYTCDSLTDDQRSGIINYAVSQLGKKYDYKLLAWEIVHLEFDFEFPIEEKNKFICSTFVADSYDSQKVFICPTDLYPTPEDISISELLRLYSKVTHVDNLIL